MVKHLFNSHIDWVGGRNSIGDLQAGALNEKISIPKTMDGPGVGINPDEMLLGAASTCYSITLAAMLERNDILLEHLKVDAKGIVDVTKGTFTYEKITYHVAMKLTKESDEVKAIKLAKRAESSCMISRAIQGNIELETIIRIEK
ncbi:OsmC family protein [Lactococcus lactis]|uniref:OsmC family protein n=1 Tax=Lactococcus lactis TaxID=1358 RepID=UPI002A9FB8DB|nr:OsmC family protein [Lactococcus lactis]